jgi:hypothetical protein
MLLSGEEETERKVTMATQNRGFQAITESCEECERETPHEVSVQIKTESQKRENAEFSREPYRVTECQICGAESSQRMNNA